MSETTDEEATAEYEARFGKKPDITDKSDAGDAVVCHECGEKLDAMWEKMKESMN